ncbi:hypothetical protein GCM10018962_75050 [Dactylosporangium matsuzakiense]|uniref:Uncharacterized protein n=1 Tax=Dactylosporangium matsuzakiense TaxID=53360 RepID=A0A9W6KV50_9ACTN|nr:hypothetical protein GCM10017581_104390 [Dactylosporangium matsuzakiense]
MLVALLAACGGSPAAKPAEAPVSADDATTTLDQVAALAAERTPGSAKLVCDTLAESCDGLSSGYRANPTSAPLPPPSILCDIALPPIPGQTGPRILVITGRDVADREYAGQVLLLRRNGHVILHEPAFWNGIRYTQLAAGRAWDAASDDPSLRAEHNTTVRSACTDPEAFAAVITGTTPPSRHPTSSRTAR